MKARRTPYAIVPLWVYDHAEVSASILVVYLGLAALSYDRAARSSITEIGGRSGLQRSSTYAALATLERIGAVEREGKDQWFLPIDRSSMTVDGNSMTVENLEEDTSIALLRRDLQESSRLCDILADLVEQNGSKRPSVTATWLIECDRLIRLDGRKPDQIERAIRWSQADPFWRANVLSMPKLRAKYDQLRLVAKQKQENGRPQPPRLTEAELADIAKLPPDSAMAPGS